MHAASRSGIALVVALSPLIASGQIPRADTLPVVRVTFRTGSSEEALRGRLVMQTSDTIVVIQTGVGERRLSVRDIKSVEASRGRHTNFGRGLAIGAVSGAALGAVIGLAAAADDPEPRVCDPSVNPICAIFEVPVRAATDPAALVVGGVVGLGAVGAITGSMIGLLTKTEKWRTVDLGSGAATASLLVRPGPRTRVGVSLRF